MEIIEYRNCRSPLGEMLVASKGEHLVGVWFEGQKYYPRVCREHGWQRSDTPLLAEAVRQLEAYFSDGTRPFELPLAPRGTPFQRAVWQVLETIPAGHTLTYGEVAQRLQAPRAVRAVGAAVGRNPLSVIIPCHRVVGANGSLTGYAGGVERKAWLLDMERGQPAMAFGPPGRS